MGVLDRVDIVIPDGHAGLTGLQILWGGRQVVPYEGAEWITGNDDEITVALGLWTGAGQLVVRTYNTDDTYSHSHLLRGYVVELAAPPGLPVAELVQVPLEGGAPSSEELTLPEVEVPEEEMPPQEAGTPLAGTLEAPVGGE